MKKLTIVFIAVMAITLAFVACKEKEPGSKVSVIEATNVLNSSNDIVTVEAQAYYFANYDIHYEAIASCSYGNKGFKLTLPKTLSDKFLESFVDFDDDDFPSWISISDKNAKTGDIELYALDKTGEECGNFYLERSSNNMYQDGEAQYVYADRNFTMKGKDEGIEEDEDYSYSWSSEYNCSFKKGWNIIYVTYDVNMSSQKVTILVTTQKPSGTNWVWNFGSWNDWDKSTSKHPKMSILNLKKNFLRK